MRAGISTAGDDEAVQSANDLREVLRCVEGPQTRDLHVVGGVRGAGQGLCRRPVQGVRNPGGGEGRLRGGIRELSRSLASQDRWKILVNGPRLPSISVDAACAGVPGPLEYRGVDTESRRRLFRAGPFAEGTNNVGEFLAIVEALRWLRTNGQGYAGVLGFCRRPLAGYVRAGAAPSSGRRLQIDDCSR